MKLLQKGYRKVFICMAGFIWSLIVLFTVWLLFRKMPDVIAPVLIGILSFGSSIILYLFASNYGEHREENGNNINRELEYHGK